MATGYDNGLNQDYCRSLSKWFASRMDAWYILKYRSKEMQQPTKPVVKYRVSDSDRIMVGHPAYVHPIDHTSPLVSNTRFVFTSPVVSKSDDGSFETANSVYVPVKG